jgi:Allene oxide cyclase barrel like domain
VARRATVAVVVLMVVPVVAVSAGALTRATTQTLVFDAVAKGSFVDKPPAGPSPGDTELSTARLRDASGRFVGTAQETCVFTKVIANDVLEQCSGSAKTSEGTVTLAGVGHLYSMNPPWRVTGRSGAYKGLHGTQVFATDIPLDPNVPLAAGRGFSVSVITVTVSRRLHVGVVPRPTANAAFIRRANAACQATEAKASRQPSFPFSNFDPFHPDKRLLPQVGRFFSQPARRRLLSGLLLELQKLGRPPERNGAWQNVLKARRSVFMNEAKQIKAALADDAPAFVRTVYQQSRDYNAFVFASAVFGVQSCTFA